MKNKKIFILVFCIILMASFAFAQLTSCTESATTISTDFTNASVSINEQFTFNSDQTWTTFVNITPTDTFRALGVCENFTINNQTNSSFYWALIDEFNASIFNATDPTIIMDTTNYSVYYTDGKIYWNITGESDWNDTLVTVCYNKTFTAGEIDLYDLSLGFTEGSNPTWGGTKTWQITRPELTEQNWTTFYTYSTRTCTARDSCLGTQAIIFSGFALIAVAMIVVAAFGIIQIFQGDVSTTSLSMVAIGIIGLSVVIMVGYTVISSVGATVCLAAVG